MNNRLARVFAGTLAGFAATLPMSLVMLIGRRKSIWKYFDPLPPRQITSRVLKTVKLEEELSDETEDALTVLNHFAYGASMGGVYGLLTDRRPALPAVTTGVFYGLGVWAVSYLGWLPASGLYRSAAEDSDERNLRMLAAHVVWGGALGYVTDMTNRRIARASRRRAAHANGSPRPKLERIKPR